MSQTTIQTYREIGLVYLDSNGCNTNFLPVAHDRGSPIPSEQGYLSLLSLLYHISILQFPEVMASISEWLGLKKQNNIRNLEQYLTCSWNYYDENNQLIVIVYRYDPPLEKKQFKPFDVKRQKFKEPEIRPLYNIPGILKSDKVILVEGEKCAEALIEKGITATTAMFGANAPIDRTDWTPLRGKHVIIWPDNDEAGNKYAKNAEKKLLELGVASLTTLKIPPNKLRCIR